MQRDEVKTIYERSVEGRRAFAAPPLDVPVKPLDELIPAALRRSKPAQLPQVSEPEIVRHYNRLSKRNFDLDTGFYPLGSCTMKHNPKLHERVAGLPGNARLHPLQDPARAQGALELMHGLQESLGEIAGMPHVSLQPSAGSHGELAGLLLTRAYHEDRGEHRTKVLTPDTAHGTNPATVTMAGYEVVKVGTNADGGVDVDDLRAKADDAVACLMLTNPNTLGVFDPQHRGDRAGSSTRSARRSTTTARTSTRSWASPARATWASTSCTSTCTSRSRSRTAAAAPAPARSPSRERIAPYLPRPQVVKRDDGTFDLEHDIPKSIGKLRGFQGNYGVFVRSYAYIRSLGAEGLREASEIAVLNANYLLALLRRAGVAEYLPAAFDRLCMHEFVLSGAPMKRDLGIRTLDLAKRLLDHGVHPPTVYFPLLVDEALLLEPTETETKETLDHFADVIASILARGEERPRDRPQRAVHDAGPPPRRGGRGEEAGDSAAALAAGANARVAARRRAPPRQVRSRRPAADHQSGNRSKGPACAVESSAVPPWACRWPER